MGRWVQRSLFSSHQALGVETEEDVYELASYFLRQLADEEGSVLSEGQELPEDEDREEFREDGAERDGDGDERKGSQDETGSQIERGSVASSSISKQSGRVFVRIMCKKL